MSGITKIDDEGMFALTLQYKIIKDEIPLPKRVIYCPFLLRVVRIDDICLYPSETLSVNICNFMGYPSKRHLIHNSIDVELYDHFGEYYLRIDSTVWWIFLRPVDSILWEFLENKDKIDL